MSIYQHDTQLCRQCGGLCCQGHAGVWVHPERFEELFCNGERLDPKALPEGIILRDLGGIEIPAPLSLERGCVFLSRDGCLLEEHMRPCQCLALAPSIDTLLEGEIHCSMPPACGSQTARQNWRRYWETFTTDQEKEVDQ